MYLRGEILWAWWCVKANAVSWKGTVKRNFQSLSQDCPREKPESVCCCLLCCSCHPDVSRCAGWFYVGCQCGEAASPDAALADVARGSHLGKQCGWFVQRNCILWSMGRKMMGVGRCLLINLEEAKTPIQHVETFKPLSTCYLQIWGRKKTPQNQPTTETFKYYNFLKLCSLLSGVSVASAWLSTAGWWYGKEVAHIEEITGHKHLLSVNKCNCLTVCLRIIMPNCSAEEAQGFYGTYDVCVGVAYLATCGHRTKPVTKPVPCTGEEAAHSCQQKEWPLLCLEINKNKIN